MVTSLPQPVSNENNSLVSLRLLSSIAAPASKEEEEEGGDHHHPLVSMSDLPPQGNGGKEATAAGMSGPSVPVQMPPPLSMEIDVPPPPPMLAPGTYLDA